MTKFINRRNILLILLLCAALLAVLPYVYPELFRRQQPATSGIYSHYLTERFAAQNRGADK